MRILQFFLAVVRHWTAWITGGYLVAVTTVLPYYGVTVPSWVNKTVVGVGLLIAIFLAWEEQVKRAEKAEKRVAELEVRPEITLDVEDYKSTANNPPEWGGAHAKQRFMIRNGGTTQAVNLTIEPILLPMAEFYKRQIGDMDEVYSSATGDTLGVRQPGWDSWIISFVEVASIGPGAETSIGFNISNMGPLQSRDICHCMSNSVRDGLKPLTIPLSLRFSNRDGSTWIQRYDLEHSFKCSFRLIYRSVELVGVAS